MTRSELDDEPVPEMVPLGRPRRLSKIERELIEFLVQAPVGDDALREQVPLASVVATCSCGCPSVLLDVEPGAPRSAGTDRSPGSPGDLTAYQAKSRGLGAQVTLHVADGHMYELEIWAGFGVRPRIDTRKLQRVQEIDWR